MAHQPVLRPYSSASIDPSDEPLFATRQPSAGEDDVAALAETLAVHGGGESSAELALDLVLNQIVEQARLATTATAAVVALMRGDELICRAASGINAPELGVRLNTRSGMSGACLSTHRVQRCEDTDNDLRPDAIALRPLGIHSILVFPVMDGEHLVGVFEIFSPRPNAFGERDVQTLEALSRRIVFNISRAADSAAPKPMLIISPPTTVVNESEIEPVLSEKVEDASRPVPRSRRDPWTDVLSALVIALALLLGWMVGREGWHEATRVTKRQVIPVAPSPAPVPATTEPAKPAVPASGSSPPGARPVAAKPTNKPKLRPVAENGTPGGLVVYDKGKVVYRWSADGAATAQKPPVYLAPETAAGYLRQRVEPVYPAEAKQQGIQGSVVLDAVIGVDGTVREVTDVSGHPQLVEAAVNAVRQWRFQPYAPAGSPVEFRTAITLNFPLP